MLLKQVVHREAATWDCLFRMDVELVSLDTKLLRSAVVVEGLCALHRRVSWNHISEQARVDTLIPFRLPSTAVIIGVATAIYSPCEVEPAPAPRVVAPPPKQQAAERLLEAGRKLQETTIASKAWNLDGPHVSQYWLEQRRCGRTETTSF